MKIGQAAQLTGLTISNIRFYERKGLLEPERNDQSKYRNYSEQDIRRLKTDHFISENEYAHRKNCLDAG